MPQTAKKNSWPWPNEKREGDAILASLAHEMQTELIEQFERLQQAKQSRQPRARQQEVAGEHPLQPGNLPL